MTSAEILFLIGTFAAFGAFAVALIWNEMSWRRACVR